MVPASFPSVMSSSIDFAAVVAVIVGNLVRRYSKMLNCVVKTSYRIYDGIDNGRSIVVLMMA